MGLYLTKQFVEENGGTILIESSLSEFSQTTLKFRGVMRNSILIIDDEIGFALH